MSAPKCNRCMYLLIALVGLLVFVWWIQNIEIVKQDGPVTPDALSEYQAPLQIFATERDEILELSSQAVEVAFGKPAATLVDGDAQLWVYTRPGDTTGLYVRFQNDVVIDTYSDEYNGELSASQL